jgi:predicted transcriptional regulator
MRLLYINIPDLFSDTHMTNVLETSTNEGTTEKQCDDLNESIMTLKNLDNELKTLQEEKHSLQDIEESLLVRIKDEIERRKQTVDQLKSDVKEIRERCEELANFVNSVCS